MARCRSLATSGTLSVPLRHRTSRSEAPRSIDLYVGRHLLRETLRFRLLRRATRIQIAAERCSGPAGARNQHNMQRTSNSAAFEQMGLSRHETYHFSTKSLGALQK